MQPPIDSKTPGPLNPVYSADFTTAATQLTPVTTSVVILISLNPVAESIERSTSRAEGRLGVELSGESKTNDFTKLILVTP